MAERYGPSEEILFPGRDPGLSYLEPAPSPLVRRRAARVRQVPASISPVVNRKLRMRIEDRWRFPVRPPVFETLSTLALLEKVKISGKGVSALKRTVLSAAAGDRVWRRLMWKATSNYDEDEVARLFAAERARPFVPVPLADLQDDTVPFLVDMRNGYNFYHFLTESLPQLAIIARADSSAPIDVHMPHLAELKGFPQKFIEAIYPQLADRVRFVERTLHYDRARVVYNHRHYLYQSSDPRVAAALSDVPADDPWHDLGPRPRMRKFLLRNTYDTGMRLLREDALARLTPAMLAAVPRRVWIGRDEGGQARERPSEGDGALRRELGRIGFEELLMERLSPLEQVAVWHGADHIVSPHGASFANMMFCRPETRVIEIGTPQTQLHRWGDFLGNAHVAECNYTTVFADVNVDDIERVPSMASGHRGMRIGPPVVEAICERVSAA